MGVGRHPIQHKILSSFCKALVLRFADIHKHVGERSNLVTYHIKTLIKQGILLKEGEQYRLSQEAEFFLPYLNASEKLKLSVVVIAIVKQNKVLFIQRDQRPYQHLWSLPGGKIRFDESIEEAAVRIAIRETGKDILVESVCGLVDERVYSDKPKHGWLLFVVKASTKDSGRGRWCAIKDLDKLKIIESDKWMVKNLLNKKINIVNVKMQELPEGMQFSVAQAQS